MSINIKKDGKLVKIAPTSYNELTDLPNIESSGDVTYITDESGKNVATIGPGGLSTTGIVVDRITLDGEDVGTKLDSIKGEIDFNDLTNNPISDNNDGTVSFADESGNKIVLIDSEGVTSVEFKADGHKLTEKADQSYVQDQITRLEASAFSGDYNDLENAPIINDTTGSAVFADEQGNQIAKIDAEGVTSVEFIAGTHKLTNKAEKDALLADFTEDSEHQTVTSAEKTYWSNKSEFSGKFGDLTDSPIIDDNSGELIYTDGTNTIVKIDASGITTTNVAIKEGDVATLIGEKADQTSLDATNNTLTATNATVSTHTTEISNLKTEVANDKTALETFKTETAGNFTAVDKSISDTNDAVDVLENKVSINEEKLEGVQASDGEFTITDGTNIGMKLDSEGLLHVKEVEVAGGLVDERLKDIENYFSTEEDADLNLNKWHEIVDFLNGFEETDQVLEKIIDTKADKTTVTALETKVDNNNTTLTTKIGNVETAYKAADSAIETAYKTADANLQKDINTRALQTSLDATNVKISLIETNYATKAEIATEVDTEHLVTDRVTLNDDTFIFADNKGEGHKIAEINASGVTSTEFTANGHQLTKKADLTTIKEADDALSNRITALDNSIKTSISTGSITTTGNITSSGTISAKVLVIDGENIKEFISGNYVSAVNPTASGNVSFGRKSGSTVGNNSVVIGYDSTASNENSIAIGSWSVSSGANSTVIGSGSTASGLKSVAIGEHNIAAGEYSFATGCWTTSNGTAGTALGNASITNAKSWAAVSSGIHTEAKGLVQHVFGMKNVPDADVSKYSDRAEHILIVGNGHSLANNEADNYASNAMSLDWDGNAWFSGDVYVGSTSGTNKDTGSVKLAKSATTLAGYGITDAYTKDQVNSEFISNDELTPVTNRIASLETNKQDVINDLTTIISGAAAGATAVQPAALNDYLKTTDANKAYAPASLSDTVSSLSNTVSNKVDKDGDKGLSEANFTNAEKTKLSKLNNYDDTQIKSDINSKASQDSLNALSNRVDALSEIVGDESGEGSNLIQDIADLKTLIDTNTSNANKVWKADNSGVPGWRTDETGKDWTSDITSLQNRATALENGKVDKDGNKVLSDVNFSTTYESTLKSALQPNALTGYLTSDSADKKFATIDTHNSAIQNLTNKFNDYVPTTELTKVSNRVGAIEGLIESDNNQVIDKWNEVVTFLDGIESSEDLDSILASKANTATTDSLDAKIDAVDKKIPTVGNAKITIQKNGSEVKSFTVNQSSNETINITVPTAVTDLSDGSTYATIAYVDDLVNDIVAGDVEITAGISDVQVNNTSVVVLGSDNKTKVAKIPAIPSSVTINENSSSTSVSSSDHKHNVPKTSSTASTVASSTHTHTIDVSGSVTGAFTGSAVDSGTATTDNGHTAEVSTSSHTHTVTGTVDNGGASHNHLFTPVGSVSGNVTMNGSASKGVLTITASFSGSFDGIEGNTGNTTATHSHNFSNGSASASSSKTSVSTASHKHSVTAAGSVGVSFTGDTVTTKSISGTTDVAAQSHTHTTDASNNVVSVASATHDHTGSLS